MPTPSSTMMIARLLIGLVTITTWQPRAQTGEQLVRGNTAGRRDALDREQLVAVATNERRHVAHLALDLRHIGHRHVHRDVSGDACLAPADEHRSNVAQRTAVAVGVADRQRGDAGLPLGTKGGAVAHGIAGLDGADIDYARPHRDDRLGSDLRAIAEPHTIEKHTGTRDRPPRVAAVA